VILYHQLLGNDIIAGRTRCKTTALTLAAQWDIPTPIIIIIIIIIIQIVNWLDQESLMKLSLVSKQLHDIICNEPGNEKKMHPVF
jgi:hypothetical protein